MDVSFADEFEPLGVGVGLLFVLVGVATIAGTPWTYKEPSLTVGILQVLGAIGTIGIGAGLAWLARDER